LAPSCFEEKLAFTLAAGLTRAEIRERAEFELRRVRTEMYVIARKMQPDANLPESPTPEQQQQAIAAALEKAYAEVPPRDGVVAAAQKSLQIATDFS